jgi:ankyrin repeat protein
MLADGVSDGARSAVAGAPGAARVREAVEGLIARDAPSSAPERLDLARALAAAELSVLNAYDASGHTLLMRACSRGRDDAVLALLARGVKANTADAATEAGPLVLACCPASSEPHCQLAAERACIVRMLLARGADPTPATAPAFASRDSPWVTTTDAARDPGPGPAAHWALHAGNLDAALLLLASPRNAYGVGDDDASRASFAKACDDAPGSWLALAQRAFAHAMPAAFWGLLFGCLTASRLRGLVQRCAAEICANASEDDASGCVHALALARDPAGVTALHVASELGELALAVQLLRAGANVDAACTGAGETPLHRAMPGNRVDMARLLLDWGADPAICARDGRTCSYDVTPGTRMWSELWRGAPAAQLAAFVRTPVMGKTPLLRCAERGDVLACTMLLELGADVAAAVNAPSGGRLFIECLPLGGAMWALLLKHMRPRERAAYAASRDADGNTPLLRIVSGKDDDEDDNGGGACYVRHQLAINTLLDSGGADISCISTTARARCCTRCRSARTAGSCCWRTCRSRSWARTCAAATRAMTATRRCSRRCRRPHSQPSAACCAAARMYTPRTFLAARPCMRLRSATWCTSCGSCSARERTQTRRAPRATRRCRSQSPRARAPPRRWCASCWARALTRPR